MKRLQKNKKGFTLVELIVVIAILGVLAAILVPAFTGYVTKSKDAQKIANANSYCTAYQTAWADAAASSASGTPSATEISTKLGELWSGTAPATGTTKGTVVIDATKGTCSVNQ